MLRKLLRFLISRHFQAILLFGIVFVFVSMLDAVPLRTKPCPLIMAFTASESGDLIIGWDITRPSDNIYETTNLRQIFSCERSDDFTVLQRSICSNGQYFVTSVEAVSRAGRASYQLLVRNIQILTDPIIIPNDGGLRSFAISPDSTRLVSADDYRGKSSEKTRYTLSIWNMETGKRILELASGHQGLIMYADWSPDGTRIATASMDGTIRLWDANTGLETKCLQNRTNADGYRLAAFSTDGKTVVGWTENDKLISWDAETGMVKSRHDLFGHNVSYYRYGLEHDIVTCMYSADWVETIEKKYDKWLPKWAKEWLQIRLLRYDVYYFQAGTASLKKVMTLPPKSKPLAVVQGTQELIAFEKATDLQDWRLTWYSLELSYSRLRSLTWAAAISLGYWLLLSLFAWRRRSKLKLQSTG